MLALLLVLVAVAWRLALPHLGLPWDFTPVLAALLFFGARTERKWMWLPVVLLAAADVSLNRQNGYPLTGDLVFSWAWYLGAVWLGGALRNHQRSISRVASACVGGSVAFFLMSNFGVWLAWNMYPKTLGGLLSCYAAGVPFYRNRIIGDLVFTALFFALPALLKARQAKAERAAM